MAIICLPIPLVRDKPANDIKWDTLWNMKYTLICNDQHGLQRKPCVCGRTAGEGRGREGVSLSSSRSHTPGRVVPAGTPHPPNARSSGSQLPSQAQAPALTGQTFHCHPPQLHFLPCPPALRNRSWQISSSGPVSCLLSRGNASPGGLRGHISLTIVFSVSHWLVLLTLQAVTAILTFCIHRKLAPSEDIEYHHICDHKLYFIHLSWCYFCI